MKRGVLKYLQFSTLLFLATCNIPEKKPDGAYENISLPKDSSILDGDALRTITLFKDGYWLTISFTQQSFISCYGGTYQRKNVNCVEKIDFNSAGPSLVGKEYVYKYESDNRYLILNFDGSDIKKNIYGKIVYRKITNTEPLKNASLEGAWLMKPGQGGYNSNNKEFLRIFAYPCFAKVIFNYKEKKFIAAYCGVYQFDGKSLIETIQYSFSDIALGATIEWDVKNITNNEIQLFDIDSFSDEEIYDRSNNQ